MLVSTSLSHSLTWRAETVHESLLKTHYILPLFESHSEDFRVVLVDDPGQQGQTSFAFETGGGRERGILV